jgi:hypothetical protein
LPLEKGIVVCEGTVTARQARVDKEHWEFTNYRECLNSGAFTTVLAEAKKTVVNKLKDDIRFHELRIARLKNTLANVYALTENAAVWTDTRGDDP